MIPVEVAASILAIRSAMEGLIVSSTSDPEAISTPSEQSEGIMKIVRALCKPSAAGSNVDPQQALLR